MDDLVQDILSTLVYDPQVELAVINYISCFLIRWNKRIDRDYTSQDSYAAAIIGSRRLMDHLKSLNWMIPQQELLTTVEKSLAKLIVSTVIDSQSLRLSIQKYGLEKVASTNFYQNSIYVHHLQGRNRDYATQRISSEYINRANEWNPQVAQEASNLKRKISSGKPNFMSLFIDLEASKLAMQQITEYSNEQSSLDSKSDSKGDSKGDSKSDSKSLFDQPDIYSRTYGKMSSQTNPIQSNHGQSINQTPSSTFQGSSQSIQDMPSFNHTRRGSAEALLESVLDECIMFKDDLNQV